MDITFVSFYRSRRNHKNPESIETYLVQVDSKDVLTKAFYFVPNEHWGFDFWTGEQERLNHYIKEHIEEAETFEWQEFKGLCKALKRDWDSKTISNIRYKEQRDKALERCIALYGQKPVEKKDLLAELGFTDVEIKKSSSARLKEDEISVNTRKGSKKVTFNAITSQEIIENGNYSFASLMQNKEGDVVLALNGERGVPVRTNGGKDCTCNIVISNKDFAMKMRSLLDIQEDYEKLKFKELAKTDNYVAYKIIKA